jgi:hypothetical protein
MKRVEGDRMMEEVELDYAIIQSETLCSSGQPKVLKARIQTQVIS